ncbi:MAG: flagellar protein FliT [Solibacillus sp.]
MEKTIQALLQISAKLYEQLAVIPEGTERDEFITDIEDKLDERGELMEQLKEENFIYDDSIKMHQMLLELDKGIRARLKLISSSIQKDLRELKMLKQQEQKYSNPYADVRTMDGKYIDNKR